MANVNLNFNLDDDIEMEENIHDSEKMISMSIIENEMEVMQALIKATRGDERGFY